MSLAGDEGVLSKLRGQLEQMLLPLAMILHWLNFLHAAWYAVI